MAHNAGAAIAARGISVVREICVATVLGVAAGGVWKARSLALSVRHAAWACPPRAARLGGRLPLHRSSQRPAPHLSRLGCPQLSPARRRCGTGTRAPSSRSTTPRPHSSTEQARKQDLLAGSTGGLRVRPWRLALSGVGRSRVAAVSCGCCARRRGCGAGACGVDREPRRASVTRSPFTGIAAAAEGERERGARPLRLPRTHSVSPPLQLTAALRVRRAAGRVGLALCRSTRRSLLPTPPPNPPPNPSSPQPPKHHTAAPSNSSGCTKIPPKTRAASLHFFLTVRQRKLAAAAPAAPSPSLPPSPPPPPPPFAPGSFTRCPRPRLWRFACSSAPTARSAASRARRCPSSRRAAPADGAAAAAEGADDAAARRARVASATAAALSGHGRA